MREQFAVSQFDELQWGFALILYGSKNISCTAIQRSASVCICYCPQEQLRPSSDNNWQQILHH